MKRYVVYVAGSRDATEYKVFARTNFEARQKCAKACGVDITDCVAVLDSPDRARAPFSRRPAKLEREV